MTAAMTTKYFPNNVLGKNQETNNLMVSYYSFCLSAMGEPSVWEMSRNRESHVYRFLRLPTFGSPAVVVRLSVEKDGTAQLISNVTGHCILSIPTGPSEKKTKHLTKEQTNTFLGIVEKTDFWNDPPLDDRIGLDGEHWIVEGVRNGRYHLVDRWSPEKGVCLELGRHLTLDLAGVELGE